MGIRLVLRNAWRFMLKMRERLGDIVKHGDVDSSPSVIPFDDHHAKVQLTAPIV